MIVAEVPRNEKERLEDLAALNVLFTPAEERFDRITRLAARSLGMDFAMLNLVAIDYLWCKSRDGLIVSEAPREVSFCSHAILQSETFLVGDALLDARFCDNPAVTDWPHIRSYAGHPVHSRNGCRVGTLCVSSSKPHEFSAEEVEILRDLAALVESELVSQKLGETQIALISDRLELERRATIDALTQMWNRATIMELMQQEFTRAKREVGLSVALIDIDHFKRINDTFGHQLGDDVLAEVASRIRQAVREDDICGRYGGEEFIVVLSGGSAETAMLVAERVRAAVSDPERPIGRLSYPPTVSIGVASFENAETGIEQLIKRADLALYQAKDGGRNRVEAWSLFGNSASVAI